MKKVLRPLFIYVAISLLIILALYSNKAYSVFNPIIQFLPLITGFVYLVVLKFFTEPKTIKSNITSFILGMLSSALFIGISFNIRHYPGTSFILYAALFIQSLVLILSVFYRRKYDRNYMYAIITITTYNIMLNSAFLFQYM